MEIEEDGDVLTEAAAQQTIHGLTNYFPPVSLSQGNTRLRFGACEVMIRPGDRKHDKLCVSWSGEFVADSRNSHN